MCMSRQRRIQREATLYALPQMVSPDSIPLPGRVDGRDGIASDSMLLDALLSD